MDQRRTERRRMIAFFVTRSLVFMVLGILLLLQPGDTVRRLARITGWLLVVLAAVDVVAAAASGIARSVRLLLLGRGAITLLLGAVLVLLTEATITIVAILAGMQLAVGGGVSILLGAWTRGELVAWRGVVLRGVVTVGFGAALIAWPEKSVVVVAVVLGAQWLLSSLVSSAIAVVLGMSRRDPAV